MSRFDYLRAAWPDLPSMPDRLVLAHALRLCLVQRLWLHLQSDPSFDAALAVRRREPFDPCGIDDVRVFAPDTGGVRAIGFPGRAENGDAISFAHTLTTRCVFQRSLLPYCAS